MPKIFVVFSSAATAEYRVAGVPAAARAAQAIAVLKKSGDIRDSAILAASEWTPSAEVIGESTRLAPDLRVDFAEQGCRGDVVRIRGERFVAAAARYIDQPRRDTILPALLLAMMTPGTAPADDMAGLSDLRRATREIMALTGKAGDGIVSRCVNRPISRAISGALLKIPGLTPTHASIGTAALAIAMTVALILGDGFGLIAGAVLFQAASIFDGVDGEMARATARTSPEGATLDSMIDAFTNLAFVTGVTVNLGLAGDLSGALAGAVALVTLATGLYLISARATAGGEPVNFDLVKKHLRRGGPPKPVTEWLIHLTMRDFFAAASALMILAGQAHLLLMLFAVGAAGWLAVTVAALWQMAYASPAKAGSLPDMSECR